MIYPYWAILMSLPVTHGFYTHEYGLPVGTIPIRVRVWLFEFIKPMGITHGCTHGLLVVVPTLCGTAVLAVASLCQRYSLCI